jgi:hypothetical protein
MAFFLFNLLIVGMHSRAYSNSLHVHVQVFATILHFPITFSEIGTCRSYYCSTVFLCCFQLLNYNKVKLTYLPASEWNI